MDYLLYLRASTQRQGQSGLGLEGQRLIAHRFIQDTDCIVAEYIEVESGRKNNRPRWRWPSWKRATRALRSW